MGILHHTSALSAVQVSHETATPSSDVLIRPASLWRRFPFCYCLLLWVPPLQPHPDPYTNLTDYPGSQPKRELLFHLKILCLNLVGMINFTPLPALLHLGFLWCLVFCSFLPQKEVLERAAPLIGFLLSENGERDGGRIEGIVVRGGGRGGGGKFHTDTEGQGRSFTHI